MNAKINRFKVIIETRAIYRPISKSRAACAMEKPPPFTRIFEYAIPAGDPTHCFSNTSQASKISILIVLFIFAQLYLNFF